MELFITLPSTPADKMQLFNTLPSTPGDKMQLLTHFPEHLQTKCNLHFLIFHWFRLQKMKALVYMQHLKKHTQDDRLG
jgi:hypothetical protein